MFWFYFLTPPNYEQIRLAVFPTVHPVDLVVLSDCDDQAQTDVAEADEVGELIESEIGVYEQLSALPEETEMTVDEADEPLRRQFQEEERPEAYDETEIIYGSPEAVRYFQNAALVPCGSSEAVIDVEDLSVRSKLVVRPLSSPDTYVDRHGSPGARIRRTDLIVTLEPESVPQVHSEYVPEPVVELEFESGLVLEPELEPELNTDYHQQESVIDSTGHVPSALETEPDELDSSELVVTVESDPEAGHECDALEILPETKPEPDLDILEPRSEFDQVPEAQCESTALTTDSVPALPEHPEPVTEAIPEPIPDAGVHDETLPDPELVLETDRRTPEADRTNDEPVVPAVEMVAVPDTEPLLDEKGVVDLPDEDVTPPAEAPSPTEADELYTDEEDLENMSHSARVASLLNDMHRPRRDEGPLDERADRMAEAILASALFETVFLQPDDRSDSPTPVPSEFGSHEVHFVGSSFCRLGFPFAGTSPVEKILAQNVDLTAATTTTTFTK